MIVEAIRYHCTPLLLLCCSACLSRRETRIRTCRCTNCRKANMLFPASSGIAAHTAAPPHIQRHRGEGGSQKKKKKKMYRKCIEMYRNVSKCIGSFLVVKVSVGEMYRNVSKCIEMYRNVSGDFWNEPKRIEQFSRIKKTKLPTRKSSLRTMARTMTTTMKMSRQKQKTKNKK